MQTLANKQSAGTAEGPPAGDRTPLLARANVYKIGVQVAAPIAAMFILLALWQVIVEGARVPNYILPAPSAFLPAVGKNWPELWSAPRSRRRHVPGQRLLLGGRLAGAVGHADVPVACQVAG